MRKLQIAPLTYADLQNLARPQFVDRPEGIPWVLYDTVPTVLSGPTRLEFFTTLQTNKSLGNMDLAGQLTAGEYFMIDSIGLDIIVPPTVTAAASAPVGALSDIHEILFGDAVTGGDSGRFSFNMLSKSIGPFPISFLHASGGPTGNGWGTETTATTSQYANNGVFDGGFPMASLVIPPSTTFSVVLEWGGATTLVAERALRVWMYGTKYRPVR
jgi:hypothetical protein